jgi:hypothetical protein
VIGREAELGSGYGQLGGACQLNEGSNGSVSSGDLFRLSADGPDRSQPNHENPGNGKEYQAGNQKIEYEEGKKIAENSTRYLQMVVRRLRNFSAVQACFLGSVFAGGLVFWVPAMKSSPFCSALRHSAVPKNSR